MDPHNREQISPLHTADGVVVRRRTRIGSFILIGFRSFAIGLGGHKISSVPTIGMLDVSTRKSYMDVKGEKPTVFIEYEASQL